jgi:uncharacterized protein YbcI
MKSAIPPGISRLRAGMHRARPPSTFALISSMDLLFVRLKGVVTGAERHLVKTLPAERGRDLLKWVPSYLVETARPTMEAMVPEITRMKLTDLHHDGSTATGEEVVLFALAGLPLFRETKKEIAFIMPLFGES